MSFFSLLKGSGKEKSQTWTTLTPCKCCENKLDIFSTWISLSHSLFKALIYSMLFSALLGTSITQIIKNSHTTFFSTIIFLRHRGRDGLRTPNSDYWITSSSFKYFAHKDFFSFPLTVQIGPAHPASGCQGERHLLSLIWAAALSQTLSSSSTGTYLFPGWGG